MNTDAFRQLPPGLELPDGIEKSATGHRPNRLCVCFSDVHFTDCTVGRQNAEDVVWEEVFDDIMDLCVDKEIKELTLVVAGDSADMIRTSRWAQHGVYPWERNNPQYKTVLREIIQGIIGVHAKPKSLDGYDGFFHLLKTLPNSLAQYSSVTKGLSQKSQVQKIEIIVLLGNHDKDLLADDETLKMFYQECLGQPVATLSPEYRRWIGRMYYGDENHYQDPASVPRLPFYWGDVGFRFFVTHGQWRDTENCRQIAARGNATGWKVKDGWLPAVWQALDYRPFTESCFGDSVAAGVLSGFIYRAKNKLNELEVMLCREEALTPAVVEDITILKRVLDELDLYRPSSAAVRRIIEETRRLRRSGPALTRVRAMIENELLSSIYTWLHWDFTFASAAPSRYWLLKTAKIVTSFMKAFGAKPALELLYLAMSILEKLQKWDRDAPSYREMLTFPAFLEPLRNLGFHIHGEGHTHIPLQEEIYFKKPEENKNYTYVNFGAWRDQVVQRVNTKYRRRGVGRMLSILDLAPEPDKTERRFFYWVQDVLSWGDQMDRM